MLGRANTLALLLCSISTLSCSGPTGQSCAVDYDCESGFCKADGTCTPADVDAAVGTDAPGDGTSALCTPNHDGSVTLAELPLQAGRMGTFRIATNATWNTA